MAERTQHSDEERRLIVVQRLPGGRQTARMGTVLDVDGSTARVRFDAEADGERGDAREIDLRGATNVKSGLALVIWDRTNDFKKKIERGDDVRVTEVYGLNADDDVFVVRGPSPERHKIKRQLRADLRRLGKELLTYDLPMDDRMIGMTTRKREVLARAGWTPPDDFPDDESPDDEPTDTEDDA